MMIIKIVLSQRYYINIQVGISKAYVQLYDAGKTVLGVLLTAVMNNIIILPRISGGSAV